MLLSQGIKGWALLAALGLVGCGQDEASADNAEAVSKPLAAAEIQPSFDCSQQLEHSIETLICQDAELAALDQEMADVYRAASETEKARQDKYFKARQRGWIKGRNDCWKADDKRSCTQSSYHQRIAELQATYGLIQGKTVVYACDDGDVMVTYFETDPATAVAQFKGEESFMNRQPSASGARYLGRNESLWEHQGEATIVWGYEAPEMRCTAK